MASAVIGALRVNLGIDSAAFSEGLKEAQSRLSKFGATLKTALVAAAAAASAAFAGLAYAIKGVIDKADNLSKAAQSVGIATEELSRLAWAADLSGVSFETLTGSLGKLSNAMAQSLQSATSQQAKAFHALGISVTNVDGTMKSARQVFGEVSDAFAKMDNSSTKTALAIQIFGRSGAQLIPLLNSGEAGLRDIAAEAERLGIVIDTQTGRRAEAFNDTLTRMQNVFQGVLVQITSLALPALQAVADSFYNAAGQNERLNEIINGAVIAFKSLASAGIIVVDTFSAIAEVIMGIGDAIEMMTYRDFAGANTRMEQAWKRTTELIGRSAASISKIWDSVATVPEPSDNFVDRLVGVPQLPGAVAAHKVAATEVADAWAGLREATDAGSVAVSDFGKVAENIGQSVSGSVSSWIDPLLEGTFKLSDAIADLGRQILRTFAQRAVSSIFTGGFGLPGFATGGSFQVGGSGGIDSQLVAFRASPNETVSITKPGQMVGGSGGTVTIALGPGLEASMLDKAARQSVRIVQQAAPGIATQGAGKARESYSRSGGWSSL